MCCATTVIIRPVRPSTENETFRWDGLVFDVAGILNAIESELSQVTGVLLSREDIEGYCHSALGKKVQEGQSSPNSSKPIGVNHTHSDSLDEEDLERPVILANIGKGAGFIKVEAISGSPDYILIDGNHRMLNAYCRGKDEIVAYVLDYDLCMRFCTSDDCLD